jgi:chaperone modulatory protein CbpM
MKLTETDIAARSRHATVRRLRLWVRRGWIAPARGEAGPVYDETDLARIELVCQLKAELELDDDAVPIVLSLIDQLHGVRRELRGLAAAVDRQPDETRRRVLEAWRGSRSS